MPEVRAKFKVRSVEKTPDGEGEQVMLMAVTDDSPENKTWSKYTPAGQITMTINNPECFGKYVPGKEMFVDFTPAD